MPKDYFAEEIENQSPVTGNILIDRKNILPTKRDYFTEEIGNTELVNKPNILKQVGQGFKNTPTTLGNMGNAVLRGIASPFVKSIGAAGLGIESMISRKPMMGGYDVPFPGGSIPVRPVKNLSQAAGLALQGGAMAAPGLGTAGAMYGAGGALEEGKSPVEVGLSALAGAGAGKLAGLALGQPLFTGKLVKDFANGLKAGTTKLRDYPANKVNSIRRGFWDNYAPEEYKAYENGIENLANNPKGTIQGDLAIQNLEKKLVDRNLMSTDGTLQKGFTPADNKLIKAYQDISRKWADNKTGELPIKDIIDEWRNIRGKYTGKPTPAQRQNIEAANDFFNSISDQINTTEFSKVKMRYRNFKENQQLIHEAIDLYAPEMKTAKGERFLTKGNISETTQGRKTAGLITEKTGQSLKGSKTLTKIGQLNPLRLLKR